MTVAKTNACILVVDDARETLTLIQRILTPRGYRVLTASGAAEAFTILENTDVDLVITDYKMPQVNGIDLIRYVRENYRDLEIMMITGYPSISTAVEAIKTGSQEYLTKPFTEDELLQAVQRRLDALSARRKTKHTPAAPPSRLAGLLGESSVMQATFRAMGKAARTKATVLIAGESGTGKELAARSIHYSGERSAAPFVSVNCSSIPENLLESELFGHMKGAFSGANETRAGFFQTADRGTIFLDEIGDTSLPMQAKLLRVLQNGEFYLVGSSRPTRVDVRVLAASNKDLRRLVKNELFREDLFFRLNVISIIMPPLRERENDVYQLASHFLEKFSEEMRQPAPRFTDRALHALKHYSWPGNVRELENLIQRLVVMTEETVIDMPDLPREFRYSMARNGAVDRTLAEVETDHIRNVLASVKGNKTRAAEVLGINRKTLREKLRDAPPAD
ncbi:MAG: sigma-54 dependent transcriptional regulator [Acidobacteriota bacterium]